MLKVKVLILMAFILIILPIGYFYLEKIKKENDVYYYLPELKKYTLKNVFFTKLYADPSYLVPYNILISFECDNLDSGQIVETIKLKQRDTIDTIQLKANSWIDEYKLYFLMTSINAKRYQSLEDKEKKVEWWKPENYNNPKFIYASPYIDIGGIRGTVNFGEKNNGRIVCYKNGGNFYILIECWG